MLRLATNVFVTTLILAATTVAQTSTLRAAIDDLPGTPRRFVVEGAPNVRLVSANLNLAVLYDSGEFQLTVRRQSASASSTILEVLEARRIGNSFEIDDALRSGATARFEVLGPAGARSAVFLDLTSRTGFLPLGTAGSWLLSPNADLVGQGALRSDGSREFSLRLPADASLVGLRITAQAAILNGNSLFLTEPDSATVQR